MLICLNNSWVFNPLASRDDNAAVLKAYLEALIVANLVYLRSNPQTPLLYNSGVRYARTVEWDSIPDLYARGFGDCKSLTAARVAELRARGKVAQPAFRFAVRANGARDFHILVFTPEAPGGWEDPSRKLGMEDYFRAIRASIGSQPT
jgi:hypothetical protein